MEPRCRDSSCALTMGHASNLLRMWFRWGLESHHFLTEVLMRIMMKMQAKTKMMGIKTVKTPIQLPMKKNRMKMLKKIEKSHRNKILTIKKAKTINTIKTILLNQVKIKQTSQETPIKIKRKVNPK